MNFKINSTNSLKRRVNLLDQSEEIPIEITQPSANGHKRTKVEGFVYQTEKSVKDSEDDPLESFMAELNKEIAVEQSTPSNPDKGTREDIANEDQHEEYIRFMDEHRHEDDGEDCQFLFDDEGNVVGKAAKEVIEPLPNVDHGTVHYPEFRRNFYKEAEDISRLNEEHVSDLRGKLNVRVSGLDPPKPVTSFPHFGFDGPLLESVRKSGFTVPTAIQSQGIPVVLEGRDLIGIAKTGSGKTLAFIWPMIIHVIDQEPLRAGQGPIALIVCPTRELAQQTTCEAVKYGRPYQLRVVCAYGGGNMWEQQKGCQAGAEVVVCTPGRLIDLVKKKATNLRRVTFLVFDEADKIYMVLNLVEVVNPMGW